MKAWALLVLLALLGCSGISGTKERDEGEYRRADTRIAAAEEFELRKRNCAQAGGTLQVRRLSGARQPPRVREMKAATCTRMATASGVF